MKGTRRIYLELEQQTLRLDEGGDEELSDRIRDLMDFVWFKRLSAEDRRVLNARGSIKRDYLMDCLFEEDPSPPTEGFEDPVHGEIPYLPLPLKVA